MDDTLRDKLGLKVFGDTSKSPNCRWCWFEFR